MNSYGDPTSPHGRAQSPGPYGGPGRAADDSYQRSEPDAGWPGNGSGIPGGAGPRGRASVGKASPANRGAAGAGRAQVGSASVGSASVGSASAGRARVGAPAGSGIPEPGGSGSGTARPAGRASAGRASVGAVGGGTAGATGRATVGRAAVSPVSPGGPGGNGPGGNGPGGNGPGGNGPGGRRGRGGTPDPDGKAKAKRRKRLNWIVASFAVFIMLVGGGVVGFTYYTTTVPTPRDITLASATTILYNNGQQMAKLGDQNRELVTIRQIPLYVQREVASAEDRKFYEHSGVDYAGIVRAAFNNFTGGSKQGASTITQQYARNAYANLQGDTYARKVREAVLASKLNDKFSKDQIMEHYLNTIFFGRGAYGIQAAAQAYFGKSVDKLTVAEGAVLAGVIKQPLPDTSTGHLGYDPAKNPTAAKDRWNYVLDGMVEKKWLSPAERPTEYPQTLPVSDKCAIDCGVNSPQGNVVNYVKDEMAQMGICTAGEDPNSTKPTCSQALRDGGYKITTTIDKKMQEAAVATAQRASKGSLLNKQPPNLMAAVVSVDPSNGRVLAYYGGDNGTGTDYAGKNIEGGVVTGGHPPGSTFKVYTLAAGLKAGVSLDSHWDATPFKIPGTEINVQNADRNPGKNVSLQDATLQSYNVPFYYLTKKIGTDKVIDMAKAAGITTMWTTNTNPAKAYDLADKSGAELTPSPFFTGITGYGQYPITVLDHANGMATFANRGVYNKAHFVVSVQQKNKDTGQWETVNGEKLAPKQTVPREVADNVTLVLKGYPKVAKHELANGRPAAEKTGTWELNETSKDNAHAWMVGYTPQLATAVWVGNVKENKALREADGTKISGAGLPGDIFERYMNAALKGKKIEQFPDGVEKIGDPNAGNGIAPPPPPPPDSGCADPFHIFCQDQNPGRRKPDRRDPGQQDPGQLPGTGDGGTGGGILPTPLTNRRN